MFLKAGFNEYVSVSVWFTTPLKSQSDNPYIFQLVERLQQRLLHPPSPRYRRYTLAKSPDSADIILFLEDYKYKDRSYVFNLLDNELVRAYPDRCFAFDWQPEPPGLLPGVYVSMPRRRQDPARFRPGAYLEAYNTLPQHVWEEARQHQPTRLFSFRGNVRSHPVRQTIADAGFHSEDISITWTTQWFDHDDDAKAAYARDLYDSKFVLCPRGIATSSYRLYETMSMGRVPVILSDEWCPPAGVFWNECALWIAEDRVAELPEIIRRHEPYWHEMGQNARRAWETFFAPDVTLYWTLRSVEDLMLFRRADAAREERDKQARWASWSFAWRNGWTLPQKIHGAVRAGDAGKRLRRKVEKTFGATPPQGTRSQEGTTGYNPIP